MRTVVTMLLVCVAGAFGQALPDAPSFSRANPTRTADATFWITTGVYGAAVAGDAITTSLSAGRTSSCPRGGVATELRGARPTSASAGLRMAGEFVIATVTSYEFKKHNFHIGKVRLWELPFADRTYAHSHGILSNLAACG